MYIMNKYKLLWAPKIFIIASANPLTRLITFIRLGVSQDQKV